MNEYVVCGWHGKQAYKKPRFEGDGTCVKCAEEGKRKIVSVLVECDGRTYRVIDNLREFLSRQPDIRTINEQRIGRKVLDLARELEVKPSC
jgi:hypothetical protein